MPEDNFLNNNNELDEKNPKEKRFRAKLSEKGFTIDYLRKDFEKSLPYLTKELNSNTNDNAKFSLNKYAQDLIKVQSDESEEYQEEELEEDLDEENFNNNYNDFTDMDESINPGKDLENIDEETNFGKLRELSQKDFEHVRNSIKSRVKSEYSEDSELYLPKTEDFLRRCSSIKEAEEIIAFQLKQKYITETQAEELIKICREKGLTIFGPKKEWGYYERTYRNKANSP